MLRWPPQRPCLLLSCSWRMMMSWAKREYRRFNGAPGTVSASWSKLLSKAALRDKSPFSRDSSVLLRERPLLKASSSTMAGIGPGASVPLEDFSGGKFSTTLSTSACCTTHPSCGWN
uniref:Uncharacterized protein n=1 Tax=Ixodes ricinus TaxID=34613 RepID=A0A6B0ULV5_IXORI